MIRPCWHAVALVLTVACVSDSFGSPPKPPASQEELRLHALAAGAGGCEDIRKVRSLPSKAGMLGSDPAYNRIVVHAAEYRRCLIVALSDSSPADNVHIGRGLHAETVADVAYAILVDAGVLAWGVCVPAEILESPVGSSAFYAWLRTPQHRQEWSQCILHEAGNPLCVRENRGDSAECFLTPIEP